MIRSLTVKIEHLKVEDNVISLIFSTWKTKGNHLVPNFEMLYFHGQRPNHSKTGCFSRYLPELGTMRYSELVESENDARVTWISAKTQDKCGFLQLPIMYGTSSKCIFYPDPLISHGA